MSSKHEVEQPFLYQPILNFRDSICKTEKKSTCLQHPPVPNKSNYKISAPWKKNAPGSVLEQEKCPWKIIPGSYPSSFIPSCDSNATTVGYCWCLLLAPNQRLWAEQVARMGWKRAKLLKTRIPMKPKTGEDGPSVKKSEPDCSIWLCALCAPMVCHPYHLKTSNFWNWKWVVSHLRQLRQITPFSGQITLLKIS